MRYAVVMLLVVWAATPIGALSLRDFVDYDTEIYAAELGILFGVAERLKYNESSNQRYARVWEPITRSWSKGWWGLNTRWLADFARRFNGKLPTRVYLRLRDRSRATVTNDARFFGLRLRDIGD